MRKVIHVDNVNNTLTVTTKYGSFTMEAPEELPIKEDLPIIKKEEELPNITVEANNLKLIQIIEKIEYLESQRKDLLYQISDVYKEAKVLNLDTKAIKKIISLRKIPTDERIELEYMIERYKEQINMKSGSRMKSIKEELNNE